MPGKFEPKVPANLDPPKYDPISLEELSKANGKDGGKAYVAIKGIVYDVTGKEVYQPGGAYHVFVGKDASRALGLLSTKAEEVTTNLEDFNEQQMGALNDWITYFSKRYNIVGVVQEEEKLE